MNHILFFFFHFCIINSFAVLVNGRSGLDHMPSISRLFHVRTYSSCNGGVPWNSRGFLNYVAFMPSDVFRFPQGCSRRMSRPYVKIGTVFKSKSFIAASSKSLLRLWMFARAWTADSAFSLMCTLKFFLCPTSLLTVYGCSSFCLPASLSCPSWRTSFWFSICPLTGSFTIFKECILLCYHCLYIYIYIYWFLPSTQ
jgi:hypothetical protein